MSVPGWRASGDARKGRDLQLGVGKAASEKCLDMAQSSKVAEAGEPLIALARCLVLTKRLCPEGGDALGVQFKAKAGMSQVCRSR